MMYIYYAPVFDQRRSIQRRGSILPSRNWYQFADLERKAGLVSPEHVERHRESNPVPPDCESGELTTTLSRPTVCQTEEGRRKVPSHSLAFYSFDMLRPRPAHDLAYCSSLRKDQFCSTQTHATEHYAKTGSG